MRTTESRVRAMTEERDVSRERVDIIAAMGQRLMESLREVVQHETAQLWKQFGYVRDGKFRVAENANGTIGLEY